MRAFACPPAVYATLHWPDAGPAFWVEPFACLPACLFTWELHILAGTATPASTATRAPRRQTSTSSLTMARSCRRGISGCPVCSGSRAALMTGRQCVRRNRINSLPPQFPACRRRAQIAVSLLPPRCGSAASAQTGGRKDTVSSIYIYSRIRCDKTSRVCLRSATTTGSRARAFPVCSAPLWRRACR